MKQMLLEKQKNYPRDCTAKDFERIKVIKQIMDKDLESFLQVMKQVRICPE